VKIIIHSLCGGVEKHRLLLFFWRSSIASLSSYPQQPVLYNLSRAGGELGDGLGALRHGMLGKLTRKEETDGSLDLAGRQGGLLVVARQTGRLQSNALEDIIDEGVQDGHTTFGDASVGVNLLQHLVYVGRVRLGSLGTLLGTSSLLGGLDGLLSDRGVLSRWRHDCCCCFKMNVRSKL
jgi:hypothetical protein